MRNFVANFPIHIALFFKNISDKLFNVGFQLHIKFDTVAGKKLKEVDIAIKAMMKQAQEAQTADRKLVNIINGDTASGQRDN